jgi:hypothetical protein
MGIASLHPSYELPFTAEGVLMPFSLPNFFFHATTAYDILPYKGRATRETGH